MIWSIPRSALLAFLVAWPSLLPAQEPGRLPAPEPGPAAGEDSSQDGVESPNPAVAPSETAQSTAAGATAAGATADGATAAGATADGATADGATADVTDGADPETRQLGPAGATSSEPPEPGGSEEAAPAEPSPAELQAYQEELDRRRATFVNKRQELEEAVWELRKIYIIYTNRDDRSPAFKKSYFDQRTKVRKLLDETYHAALDVCRMEANEEAATYLVTMIQHRFERDMYDATTMEAAARMIDGGSNLGYLFLAAARSAIAVGNFDMAEKLYAVLNEEQKEDVDMGLEYHLDTIRENFVSEQAAREKEAQEDRLPRVLFRTSQGDVLVELFLDSAPSTVSHFISLVEDGFYDGHDFYQVMDNLLALTGDPSGAGDGNCGKYIIDEHQNENARKAFSGSLVMAKLPIGESGEFVPNSASSQFAILYLPITSASEQQTIFGRVIDGMDAIGRLRRVDPSKKKEKGAIVQPPDMIYEAKVVRRPDTLPEPKYLHVHQHGPGGHGPGEH